MGAQAGQWIHGHGMTNLFATAAASGITSGVASGVAVTIGYFRSKALHVAAEVVRSRQHFETILAIQNQSGVSQSEESPIIPP
jgi:hypothetical protein